MIVGSGSASFEIMRDLTRRLPAMIAPSWVSSKCEPIAIRDVVRYLVGCVGEARTADDIFEIGSGDVMTYRDMLRVAAEEQGRPFRMVTVPVLTPTLSSYWLHIVTSVDMRVARPLIDGLRNDVVCRDRRILDLLPGPTLSYREAVRAALHVDASERRSRWLDSRPRRPEPARRRLRLAPRRDAFLDRQVFDTPLATEELWRRVELNFGGTAAMARRPTFCGACAAAPTVCSWRGLAPRAASGRARRG